MRKILNIVLLSSFLFLISPIFLSSAFAAVNIQAPSPALYGESVNVTINGLAAADNPELTILHNLTEVNCQVLGAPTETTSISMPTTRSTASVFLKVVKGKPKSGGLVNCNHDANAQVLATKQINLTENPVPPECTLAQTDYPCGADCGNGIVYPTTNKVEVKKFVCPDGTETISCTDQGRFDICANPPPPAPAGTCPVCPAEFPVYSQPYKACCKSGETPLCRTSIAPTISTCTASQTCAAGFGCVSPAPAGQCAACTNPNLPDYHSNLNLCCRAGETRECQTSAAPTFSTCTNGQVCSVLGRGCVADFIPPPPPPCLEFDGPKCVRVNTAIGSIPTDLESFAKTLFGILLSLSGGIALLLIIYSGYRIMTSSGKPETLQSARETLTSAIIGLLFIIFSLVLLQVIGVDILKIPGFDP